MSRAPDAQFTHEQIMIYKSLIHDLERGFPELADVEYTADHPSAATLHRLMTYRESVKILKGFVRQGDE
ncbi:hypothetical protein [Neorhizobium petrolearium]|uniref:Uncharacterized protein n=1 Tax=Neorhizobium petrolearium TaxID=515361 RepID=A0ABY8M1B1_9HYPH|nr:hypothetical protein [Neorhizobium petrolearium]MCC2612607.1 hypothetical protein [Neorhizobium petrolearium]WGI67731.1 hypothetical protein QEO92_22530 [Neorhizobium petrolearium]